MFRHLVDPSRSGAIPADNPGFIGCIEYEDVGKNTDQEDLTPADSSARPTYPETEPTRTSLWNRINGQYMIGYIAVGIYLMESVGSQENWYAAAEQTTFNEIVEGLDFLAQDAFDRGVKVVWVYAPMETISTNYEPITGRSVPYYQWIPPNWIFNWLDDIYTSHGLTDEWDGAFDLANQLRRTLKTNWAVEIAVVMDDNDADHKFSNGRFAYVKDYEQYSFPFGTSEFRAPIVVMTYNNANWGPSQMNYVAAHEVSHVFGASDEYFYGADPPPPTCKEQSSCGHQRAFLTWHAAVNGNCEKCNTEAVSCFMRSTNGAVCSFTPPELGWRDMEDGDGAADPIDLNSGYYCWIKPVAAGDLLRIFTIAGEFMDLISVSDDMLCGENHDAIFWDGSMYKDDYMAGWGLYPVSKNGSGLGTFYLNYSSGAAYTISTHYFNLDTVSFRLENGTINIRHTIIDSMGDIYSRPRFDVMTDTGSIKSYIYGYDDGIYTSEVFGWRSDGASANLSTITFINYICADMDNNGSIDVADLYYMVDFMFTGGPTPPHMASMNLDCSGGVDISDLTLMIDWMFTGGPEPWCCHSL